MIEYKSLEPSSFQALGVPTPTFGGTESFFGTSLFIYTLLFTAIIGAAFYEFILAGFYRMQASENGIRKSNETFKRTTLGLLGVFSLFLIIALLNKNMLTGDVDLSAIKVSLGGGGVVSQSVGATSIPSTTTNSGSVSKSCESKEATILKLNSPNGICGGVTCGVLTNCGYAAYSGIIDQITGGDVQLKKMIIVTMCKESGAKVSASNKNPNGTYDCGLMQINQPGPCGADILNPAENIKKGVDLMRKKILLSSQLYTNIPAETGPFSAYNCCANNTVPNAPSVDCSVANGFPYPIPKWACPINPGEGVFNMCVVKSYACELSACMKQL